MHRLIQALTLNIDLSSLFADVLMNAATSDVATKKMLYHYIGVYSDKGRERRVGDDDDQHVAKGYETRGSDDSRVGDSVDDEFEE